MRTNYKLSEAKPRIHLLFVRTKSASNGCNRTLWKKERVQVSDIYDNNWQLRRQKKPESINSIFTCKLKALRVLSLSFYA